MIPSKAWRQLETFSRRWSAKEAQLPRWQLQREQRGTVPPRCGAKTRKGTPCNGKVVPGRNRCRMHGGAATGAKTPEGRARISEANRKRWAAWRESKRSETGKSS